MATVAFVDCETTGLDPERHDMWELAVITAQHDHNERRLTVLNHGVWEFDVDLRVADPQALQISGYYQRATMPPLTPWPVRSVARRLAGAHLVGANPSFDAAFIAKALRRQGYASAWAHHMVDVTPLAAGYIAAKDGDQGVHVVPYRSTDIAEAIGVPTPEDRHTAMADALWAMRIYAAVYELDINGMPDGEA